MIDPLSQQAGILKEKLTVETRFVEDLGFEMNMPDRVRRYLLLLILLTNTCLFAFSFLLMGEDFYFRWWDVHLIYRIAGTALIPVSILAALFISLFVQVGASNKGTRLSFTLLGLFFLVSGLSKLSSAPLSWSSVRDAGLLFWGIPLLLAAALGDPEPRKKNEEPSSGHTSQGAL